MRFVYVVLTLILCYLFYSSLQTTNELTFNQNELKVAKEKTESLKQRNNFIRSEIVNLKSKNNTDLIEDMARSNLGYKKEDEIFYRVYRVKDGKND